MATVGNYYFFNNMGRIGDDETDKTQKTLLNTRYSNYMLSNFTSDIASDSHVVFATQQPSVMFNGIARGYGLNGSVVDSDSLLLLKKKEDRPLERLQLMQRPFATVPYMGRGYGNPNIESQLQQGEMVSDRKSVSTVVEKPSNYSLFVSDEDMERNVQNYHVEETVMDGWVRGGAPSREMSLSYNKNKKN
jgi:hypothetical protein